MVNPFDVAGRIEARSRQVGRTAAFTTLTAAMLPAMLAHTGRIHDLDERERVREQWVRAWARSLLRIFAVEVASVGRAPVRLPGSPGMLVVSNHRSAVDIGILLSTFGGTMVSRADLAGWPLVGHAARAVGTIFVDRKSPESGASTIRVLQKALAAGRVVNIFPEGTTFDGDEVRPFHKGAFVAAASAGADVLPVGLAYPSASQAAYVNQTFPEHLARLAKAPPSTMALAIGEPFSSAGMRAKALTERAQGEVAACVARARARCGP